MRPLNEMSAMELIFLSHDSGVSRRADSNMKPCIAILSVMIVHWHLSASCVQGDGELDACMICIGVQYACTLPGQLALLLDSG